MEAKRIRLHLVHGTWAKGLCGTKRAWSEPGEVAYERLRRKLPGSQLESFTWSGRNSIAGRGAAANTLQQHLDQSLRDHPSDCHIILAHSHGGTVANQAVSGSDLDGAIRGLICLATPFTYLDAPSEARLQTGISAVASVFFAFFWTAVLAWFPWIPELLGIVPFAGVLGVTSVLAILSVFIIAGARIARQTVCLPPSGPRKTSLFLIRGSRDEASLLLAGAQVLDSLCAALARLFDPTPLTVRRPLTYVGYILVFTGCVALGAFAATLLMPVLMPHVGVEVAGILGMFVYGPAVAGWVYLLGYAAIAVGAGHWNLLRWLSSVVEVEAAPPNTTCQMYVFSELSTTRTRHALYEDDQVLGRVAELVQSIANP